MIVKLLTEQHLVFLSLKGGCRGSSESTHVKMPHCWKFHALAYLSLRFLFCLFLSGSFTQVLLYKVQLMYLQDPTSPSRQVASRIRQIPKGTIGAVKVHQEKYIGTIDKEASGHSSSSPGRPVYHWLL